MDRLHLPRGRLAETLSVARADGGRKRRIVTFEYFGDPFWSADGRFTGYWSSDGVGTVDLSTGKVRVLAGYTTLISRRWPNAASCGPIKPPGSKYKT